jgi:hypothetical protein
MDVWTLEPVIAAPVAARATTNAPYDRRSLSAFSYSSRSISPAA